MSVFENLTKKVTETAKAAARKSGDIVEVTKLNMNISSEEDKIKKVYTDIGKTVYESFDKGEEIPDNFKELCEKVRVHFKNIEEMKEKILELKSVKICPSCEAELDADVAFCPKCGTKQEMPKKEEENKEDDKKDEDNEEEEKTE